MAKNRKTVLAIVLAVKRGFVSPEEGMKILEQAEEGETGEAEATVFSMVPTSQQEELRADAAELADDDTGAARILEEAGVPPSIQQTLLSLGTQAEAPHEDIEATLLSLAPTRASAHTETPQLNTPAERYQILREHARGGMGRILIAVDKVVGREVALKELLPFHTQSGSTPGTPISDTSTTAAARFLREATVTGQLEHPNIVPVYEIGQRDDGSLYYTMKFVKGRTLATRLRAIRNDVDLTDQEKLRERLKLLDAFVDVCNAIAFSHSRGVIHRDIKPANIMLGDFGEALVLDWGLARVKGGQEIARKGESEANAGASADITLEGEVMGTPAYMPPEQAAGKLDQVDERSDIYSLGAVLFEIVSGEPPYKGKTAKQVLSSVLSEDPREVNDISPDAPPELAALVARALSRDPAKRFQSARALAEQVQAYRDGRMVSAYSYSAIELVSRFVAKNRAAVAVTVLALLLMVAGGVYAYNTVKAQRDTALAAEADAQAQRKVADQQAAEAKRQKGAAEQSAKDAADARDEAKLKAAEAEHQQLVAEDAALRAKESAKQAEQSERKAKASLSQAQSNLAKAHLGYAELARERNDPGEQIVHLAAAHTADPKVVSEDRLVSTMNETVFPVWHTRSYVDLPAEVASFTPDCRLCAAPLRRAPRTMDELDNAYESTYLPDIGVWDVATGTLLRRISMGYAAERTLLLNADGTRLAAMDTEGKLTLWDITTGVELSSRKVDNGGLQPLLAIGPGSETFFSASPDGKISEWNFSDGTPGRSFKADTDLNALAVSPDGGSIAVSTWNGTISIWDLATGSIASQKTLGESYSVSGFAPGGLLLSHLSDTMLSSRYDLELWDLKLDAVVRTFSTDAEKIASCVMDQTGTYLAVGLYGDGWKLFDYQSGKITQQRGKTGGNVVGVRFAPDGESLVLAQKGEGFDVLKIGGDQLLKRSPEHALGSTAIEFSPDGCFFASAGYDGRVLLRQTGDGASLWSLSIGPTPLISLAFRPDGQMLAVYGSDGVISFIDVAQGRVLRTIKLTIFHYGLRFSADGRYLAAPTLAGPIHLIDPQTATIVKTIDLPENALILSLAFDPAGDRLWMMDNSLNVREWRYSTDDTATIVGQITLDGGGKRIFNSAISPDGTSMVMSLNDGTVICWTPHPFSQRFTCNVGVGPICNSAFGKASGFFVCGTADGMLCFVNANQGEVVKKLRAHDAAVVAVAVSPDGRNIVTSAANGEFMCWDAPPIMYGEPKRLGEKSANTACLSPDGFLLAANVDANMVRIVKAADATIVDEFPISPGYIRDLQFSPDGKSLVVAITEGRLLVHDLETRQNREIPIYDITGGIDFDAQGRLLVVGQAYGLQIRNLADGSLLGTVPGTASYLDVSALPGGTTVLLSGQNYEPAIVNVDTGDIVAKLERIGYNAGAHSVSPDASTLAMVRDVGLIGFHRVDTGARIRSLKVRNQDISSVAWLPDGDRLVYATLSGQAVVIDAVTGDEILSTWLPYNYLTGAMLSADGGSLYVVEGNGTFERWRLTPLLGHLQSLAELNVEQLNALAQVESGTKLDELHAISLPRQTGNITWLTEDGGPPAFLAGPLPSWVPRLDATSEELARPFLRKVAGYRTRRIERVTREWNDNFEGYRVRTERNDDGTIRSVAIPARQKDEKGDYLGEPQGQVDYVSWLADKRKAEAVAVQQRIDRYHQLEQQAIDTGKWRVAFTWCSLLEALDPDNLDWVIDSARLQLEIGDYWMFAGDIEAGLSRATPEQRPVMLLLSARMLAKGWATVQTIDDAFQEARKAGYTADDWSLYRTRAFESIGAYDKAVAAAEQGMAECANPKITTELIALLGRCLHWVQLRNANDNQGLIVVASVPQGSQAQLSGLKEDDVVLGLKAGDEERFSPELYDEDSVQSTWNSFLRTAKPEIDKLVMTVRRDGNEIKLTFPRLPFDAGLFTLKPRPD